MAEALPGVLAVITHLNAPTMKPPPRPSVLNLVSLAPGTSVNYLNTDEVRFNGQPVALVVAESIEAAAEGAGLIDVRYLNHPDPTMPLGLVGVGEVGITGAAAAANAIYHATGKRIRDLPITLDKLL